MDELWDEFEKIKTQKGKLLAFHDKIASLNFFDPACGCGNFLVVSYRELRLLELEVIKKLYRAEVQQLSIDAVDQYVKVNVDQFHGIEIEEWPAQIAQVAMWLMDHQMNLLTGEAFGQTLVRLPLKKAANIVHENALRIDWKTVIPPTKCNYIFGNPPFIGHQLKNEQQSQDIQAIWGNEGDFGKLDYVTCWHKLSADYLNEGSSATKVAFVSTSSICQGEQASILWPWIFSRNLYIHFAHRSFRWSNEAKGVAAVYCVVVGFGKEKPNLARIFDYSGSPKADPIEIQAKNINPYLVDSNNITLKSRSRNPGDRPKLTKGSQATDQGNLFLTIEERNQLITENPVYKDLIRQFVGASELTGGKLRYCLWLVNCSPSQLKGLHSIAERLKQIKEFRKTSPTKSVNTAAQTPYLFTQIRQPKSDYIGIPRHSSSNRQFIPMAFFKPDVIAGDAILVCEDSTLFDFGLLSSTMVNSWARTVAGRLGEAIRFEASLYNNFPWPVDATNKHREAVSSAAQSVLDARASFPDSTLADLYDPTTMPPALVKAHQALDKAVDAAYVLSGGKKHWDTEAERVAFLFELYQKITSN